MAGDDGTSRCVVGVESVIQHRWRRHLLRRDRATYARVVIARKLLKSNSRSSCARGHSGPNRRGRISRQATECLCRNRGIARDGLSNSPVRILRQNGQRLASCRRVRGDLASTELRPIPHWEVDIREQRLHAFLSRGRTVEERVTAYANELGDSSKPAFRTEFSFDPRRQTKIRGRLGLAAFTS